MIPLCCWDDLPGKKQCFINKFFICGLNQQVVAEGIFPNSSQLITFIGLWWGFSAFKL